MARIERIEGMLREWGEWVRSEGKSDKGTGFPTRNCLDPDWGTPSSGHKADFKVVRQGWGSFVYALLRDHVSQRVQAVLVAHYALNQPVAEVARQLGIAPATVDQRIWRAHAVLDRVLRNMGNA